MAKISIRQEQSLTVIQSLSLQTQRRLKERWNSKLSEPLAFVPNDELKRGVSEGVATEENVKLGNFAANYLSKIISLDTTPSARVRRLAEGKILLAIGFGKGYDSQWLSAANAGGFQTWWIDVSDYACELARKSLDDQWGKMEHLNPPERPVVKCA